MIKAIQTKYKGHNFRSRLEARWAVFFDSLELDWQYEPEGFSMPDGTNYLPDFYFPQIGMYGEVKPDNDGDEVLRNARSCAYFAQSVGKPCLLLFGTPKHAGLWAASQHKNSPGELCPTIDEFLFFSCAWTSDQYWKFESRMYAYTGKEGPLPYQFDYCDDADDIFLKARDAARSARFEHGQSGATN